MGRRWDEPRDYSWRTVRSVGIFIALYQLLVCSSLASGQDLVVPLTVSSGGSEPEQLQMESLRAGAKAAVEWYSRPESGSGIPVSVIVQEAQESFRAGVGVMENAIEASGAPVVIAGGKDHARLGRGIAELHEVLLISTAPSFDPVRAGTRTVHLGRSVASMVDDLKRFLRERFLSHVVLVAGKEEWAAEATQAVSSALTGDGIAVRVIPGDISRDGLVREIVGDGRSPQRNSPMSVIVIGDASEVLQAMGERERTKQPPIIVFYGCDTAAPQGEIGRYHGELYSLDPKVPEENARLEWLRSYISERYHPRLFTFDALVGFDAVSLIVDRIGKGRRDGGVLREAITTGGEFSGVSGKIQFMPDGSTRRESVVHMVLDGACHPLQGLE